MRGIGAFAAALAVAWIGSAAAQPQLDTLCPARVAQHHGTGNIAAWRPARGDLPMLKVTLTDPLARCNDGTPAIMYVQPSPLLARDPRDPAGHNWVIHVKGGGACGSFDGCQQRWCSQPQAQLNVASLMSSRWAPEATVAEGILSQDPANRFADWNHVLLYYCSSDTWGGDMGAGQIAADPAGGAAPYAIEFHGAQILDAAITALLARPGVQADDPRFADRAMASLSQATTVVLSGDSAGATGLRMGGDRLAGMIRAASERRTPPDVLLVLDAGAAPQNGNPGLPWTAATTYDGVMAQVAASRTAFLGITPRVLDASCMAAGGNTDLCFDDTYVLLNHVTTPAFARSDLNDRVMGRQLMEFIAGGGPIEAAQLPYATFAAEDLHLLTGPGAERRDPVAVFGPLCGSHISIRNDRRFMAEQAVARGSSFHDAVAAWVDSCLGPGGCMAFEEIAPDSGPRPNRYDPNSPVCP